MLKIPSRLRSFFSLLSISFAEIFQLIFFSLSKMYVLAHTAQTCTRVFTAKRKCTKTNIQRSSVCPVWPPPTRTSERDRQKQNQEMDERQNETGNFFFRSSLVQHFRYPADTKLLSSQFILCVFFFFFVSWRSSVSRLHIYLYHIYLSRFWFDSFLEMSGRIERMNVCVCV